jgi:hypothetical protein
MNPIISFKINRNKLLLIQIITFALVFAYSLFKITEWELFPWINISIATGLPFLALFISLLVKINSERVKLLIIFLSFIHLFLNLYFLSDSELLRTQWHWLVFPNLVIFCLLFIELFSRKNESIQKIGKGLSIGLIGIIFIRFYKESEWMNYFVIFYAGMLSTLIIFSKSKSTITE